MPDLFYDTIDSVIGRLWIYANQRERVYGVSFGKRKDLPEIFSLKPAKGECDGIKQQLKEYLNRKRTSFAIEYELAGTTFQKLVWKALLAIPYGQVLSYSALAARIDRPASTRAVGNALGANPIAIIVPCHRVIRNSGELGGYSGGLDKKRFLLGLEGSLDKIKF